MARFGSPQRRRSAALVPSDNDTRKVVVTTRVAPEVRAKAQTTADALGISVSALLCELIERIEVDEQGSPGWESKYAPPPEDDPAQEHLELSA